MPKFKTKKIKKKSKQTGGDKSVQEFLSTRVNDTYNFFDISNSGYELPAKDKNYPFHIKKGESNNFTIEDLPNNDPSSFLLLNDENNYELFFPDYHGEHTKGSLETLPPNVFICIFGTFDTSSWVLPKKLKKKMNFA